MNVQKGFAILALVSVLIFVFVFGMSYQKIKTPTVGVACTMEAKLCPDGSSVGRLPPNCDFDLCPSPMPEANYWCGEMAGYKPCPEGYACRFTQNSSSGQCEKCPKYVNCMPGPNIKKDTRCRADYLEWAKLNCPGFEVVY